MEIHEILRELEFNRGYFPLAAVEAAVEQREAITPHLLQFIDHAYENAEHLDDDADETGAYMGHIYAVYLLAQFREQAAYPLIVRLAGLPEELLDALLGDVVTESLPSILASVCGGDTAPIKGMVENQGLSEWVRGAAVRAFLCLVGAGEMPREEAVACYTAFFRGGLEREASNAWDSLVSGAADLAAIELRGDIDKAFDEGLTDPMFATRKELEEPLVRDPENVRAYLRKWYHGLIDDTIKEMQFWNCFREESPSDDEGGDIEPLDSFEEDEEDEEDEPDFPSDAPLPSPIRAERVPGRNDPCPCGSGKKYKRCCGRKPREVA